MNPKEIDSDSCRVCAEFCTVFSNAVRAKILWALRAGEVSVTELAELADTSLQNVSQHLRLMRDKGAVVSRRSGKQMLYAVANPKFLEGMALIRQGMFEEMQKKTQALSPERRTSTKPKTRAPK